MPTEKSDNTRVSTQEIVPPLSTEELELLRLLLMLSKDLLWDADKTNYYLNLQDFYNTNFFGFGLGGNQTNIDPRTPEGLYAIQSNLNYATSNVRNFAENVVLPIAVNGATQAIKIATTPVKIGEGAEAVVKSAPASLKVTKTSVIPRSEMHLRNQVPAVLKHSFKGTKDGMTTYTQTKARILTEGQIAKALKLLEGIMSSKGWSKVTHPNLQGVGFTNGRWVVSDLGAGNIGRDWLGRPRLIDFAIENVLDFKTAMLRNGGRFKNMF